MPVYVTPQLIGEEKIKEKEVLITVAGYSHFVEFRLQFSPTVLR